MTDDRYWEFEILVEKIREFKESNNLTFEKIGNALGVNKSHIYRVMNMEVFPSFQFLIQLARYMDVPLASLFTLPDGECHFTGSIDQSLHSIKQQLEQIGLQPAGVNEVIEHIQSLIS